MKKQRRVLGAVLAISMLSSMTGCSITEKETAADPAAGQEVSSAAGNGAEPGNGAAAESGAGAESPAASDWAKENGLDQTESSEDLYRQALETAGGEINVYTVSGRMENVKATFEEDYPGLTLVVHDLNVNELLEKFTREYEAGIYTADVIHVKEQTGKILREFVETGMMHNYQPEDIFGEVDEQYLQLTPLYFEADWWYYNSDQYEESPIDSWWDLTREEWNGRFMMVDPLTDVGYMALLTTIVENADLMAESYKEEFGEEIVLAEDEPNAGYAFIKRFAQNNPIFDTSSNNIVKAVGASGQEDAPLGYAVSSKIREREQQGYLLGAAMEDFSPAIGIYGMNVVEIADHAPNPAGAKLLVRYLTGDADGQARGFEPYNTLGGWSVRSVVPQIEGNIAFEDLNVFPQDLNYTYDHMDEVQDYWISVQP